RSAVRGIPKSVRRVWRGGYSFLSVRWGTRLPVLQQFRRDCCNFLPQCCPDGGPCPHRQAPPVLCHACCVQRHPIVLASAATRRGKVSARDRPKDRHL